MVMEEVESNPNLVLLLIIFFKKKKKKKKKKKNACSNIPDRGLILTCSCI